MILIHGNVTYVDDGALIKEIKHVKQYLIIRRNFLL